MKNLLDFELTIKNSQVQLSLRSQALEDIYKSLSLEARRCEDMQNLSFYDILSLPYLEKYHRLDNGSIVALKRCNNRNILLAEDSSRLRREGATNPNEKVVNISYLRTAGIGKGVILKNLFLIPRESVRKIADGYYYGFIQHFTLMKKIQKLHKKA